MRKCRQKDLTGCNQSVVGTAPNSSLNTAALKELEKIEMTRMGSGEYSLDHAVTKTQKTILKSFDMDAVSVQKEAARIAKTLEAQNGKNE